MSETSEIFRPVATKVDVETLDRAEIVAGYMDFRSGDPEPGANRGRAYWHGWKNSQRDHGESEQTEESMRLAHELYPRVETAP